MQAKPNWRIPIILLRSFIVLVLVMVSAPVTVKAASDSEAATLMEISGIGEQISQLRDLLKSVPEQRTDLDERFSEAWVGSLENHFEADSMTATTRAQLMAQVTSEDAADVVEFFRSDLGARINALETAAMAAEAQAAQATEGVALLQQYLANDEARIALFQRLDAAIGASEFAFVAALNFSYSMVAGMVGAGQLPSHVTDEEILGIVSAQSGNMRAQIKQGVYSGFAYNYSTLTNEELLQYVAFSEKPAASSYYSAVLAALSDIFEGEARSFGHDLMVRMGARKS